ncbi:MAG: transglutaminaseTgpA domain-containing protein [Actinomycetota bacterium]
MASTQGTSARVQRLTSLAAITLVAVTIGLSFGRVFDGRASTVRLVGMGVASGVIAWAFERRGLLVATVASAILVVVGLGLAVFPSSTWYGLPTLETLRAMGAAAIEVGEQARLQIAPAPPVTPLLFASTTAVWAAVFSCHSLAIRAGSPLMSLVPPAALVVFADSVLEDLVRPMYGVAFLLAAMSVLFADSLRRVQGWGPVWNGPGRRDRLVPAAGRGARRIAGAAVAVAVAAPVIVPGFGGRAVIDLSAINGEGGVRVSTLVSMASELTRGQEQEVFRVRTDTESYWRMVGLEYFDGVRWQRTDEPSVAVAPGQTLGEPPEGRTITQTFEVTNDLLFPEIPTAYQATSIDLDGDVSWFANSQTALINGNLEPGDTYTVTSVYVAPTPEDLRQVPFADAPDPSLTQLPQGVSARIAILARSWTEGATTMYDQVYAIQRHLLSDGYIYDTDVSFREDAATILEFLELTKRGFCQQFSTAMAMLLRSIGIPARIAVGFTRGDPLPGEQGWSVTTDDLHAWVEVPFEGYGWLAFEPTPGRANPTAATYASRSFAQSCETSAAGCGASSGPREGPGGGTGLNDPKRGFGVEGDPGLAPLGGSGSFDAGRSVTWWLSIALVAALAIALAVLLAWPFVRRARRRRAIRRAGPAPRALVLAIYDACCRDARDLGVPRAPGETPEEYAWRLASVIPVATESVGRLSRLAERAAYGPRELSSEDVLDAEADAGEIVRSLAELRTWRDRLPRRRPAA